MTKVALFTDASRIEHENGEHSAAFGWVAVSLNNFESPFMVPEVYKMPEELSQKTVHAEVMAAYSAYSHFKNVKNEIHIFTDSLYIVKQIQKVRTLNSDTPNHISRPVRVFPEKIFEMAEDDRVFIHHVRAHKSVFFNELIDNMVRFVATGELSVEESKQWGREKNREGFFEVIVSKGHHPKKIKRNHQNQKEILSLAIK